MPDSNQGQVQYINPEGLSKNPAFLVEIDATAVVPVNSL